jgi:hypothetical protein
MHLFSPRKRCRTINIFASPMLRRVSSEPFPLPPATSFLTYRAPSTDSLNRLAQPAWLGQIRSAGSAGTRARVPVVTDVVARMVGLLVLAYAVNCELRKWVQSMMRSGLSESTTGHISEGGVE